MASRPDSCRESGGRRHPEFADVAKLVDALDLGSSASRHGGSSPSIRTLKPSITRFRVILGLRVLHLININKVISMDISLDRQKSNEALIKIKLKEVDYQPQVTQKIKEFSRKAQIKGFRPGKVPFGLVKKMYGKSIMVEEINRMLSGSLTDYIKEQDLKILGDPLPNLEKSKEIDWDHQSDFEFEYNVGLVDDFKYDLEKQKITEFKIKVDKKMVSEELETIKKNYGEQVAVETAEAEDIIHGVLTAPMLETDDEIALPVQQVEKKEQKKFIGKKAGDEVSFDLNKAIKDTEYQARLLKKSADELKDMDLSKVVLKISEVKRLQPAEMNQDFYDKLFGEGVVKTEDELKGKIEEYLTNSFQNETEKYLAQCIREEIVKATKMVLPDEFLKRWLLASNEGQVNEQEVEDQYQDYADEMKWNLILNRIAEDNDIKVENDEVVNRAKQMISAQLASSGLGDQMGDQLDAFAENYLKGKEGQNYLQVFNQVRGEKILEFIKEKVKLSSKEVNLEQFKKEVSK